MSARFHGAALSVLLGGLGCESHGETPAHAPPPAPSEAEVAAVPEAPAAVVDLEGTVVDPLQTEAPAVVLVFVSTHCPISNRYAPTLRSLAAQWQARGVRSWLVYPDPDDGPAQIREHREAFDLTLPALRDPGHQLVARAEARVTPEAAVFVPGQAGPAYHGRIDDRVAELGKVRAQAGAHELRDAVRAVLEGEPPKEAGGPAIGCYISDLR